MKSDFRLCFKRTSWRFSRSFVFINSSESEDSSFSTSFVFNSSIFDKRSSWNDACDWSRSVLVFWLVFTSIFSSKFRIFRLLSAWLGLFGVRISDKSLAVPYGMGHTNWMSPSNPVPVLEKPFDPMKSNRLPKHFLLASLRKLTRLAYSTWENHAVFRSEQIGWSFPARISSK